MIHVQLFKYGRHHAEAHAETAKLADRAIDRLITEILQGKHGTGHFEIHANHLNDVGISLDAHFMSGPFEHPAPPRVLTKPV